HQRPRAVCRGTVRPSILAVWRLMTSSYVVNASTGRSATTSASGRQPRSIRQFKGRPARFRQIQISPKDLNATLEDDLQQARASPGSAEAGADTEGQNTRLTPRSTQVSAKLEDGDHVNQRRGTKAKCLDRFCRISHRGP